MVGFKVSEKKHLTFANFMATISGSVLAENADHGEPHQCGSGSGSGTLK
jgi:hypothetical protein